MPASQNKLRDAEGSDANGTQRMCAVSREVRPVDGLVRFVLDPEGQVVPDLKAGLPGRGVWISLDREAVETAVKRKLFARGFKSEAKAPADLADKVSALLKARALSYLSMANKAGLVVQGFDKVFAAIGKGRVRYLVAANDGSLDGRGKLRQRVRSAESEAELIEVFESEQLGLALGRTNVIHAGMAAGKLADHFCQAVRRYQIFNGDSAD